MAQPLIYSVEQLKDYILRHLGAPVINIEIDDTQLDDAITDTLDEYLPVAYSGVVERFLPIQLIADTHDYILPYDVFAVLAVMGQNTLGMGATSSAQPFSMGQFIAADLYQPGTGKIDLAGYEMINQMLATTDLLFSQKTTFDFNSISKVLHINQIPAELQVMLHVYKKLDLTGTPTSGGRYAEENIYNELWIRKMAVAKAQFQWGRNITKYQGSTLPSGGNLNGEFIYNEAKDQIEKLSADLLDRYTLPNDFFLA